MISLERHPRYCSGTAGSYAKARDRADGLWAGGGRAAHAPFWPNRLVHQLLAALPTSRVIGAVPEFSDFVGHFRNSIETSAGSQSRPPTRRCSRATARMPEAVGSACEAVERCSSLAGSNAATNP
jgi:hypothetical protein